jgi:hypothetical protein
MRDVKAEWRSALQKAQASGDYILEKPNLRGKDRVKICALLQRLIEDVDVMSPDDGDVALAISLRFF